jgi:short-subunit dehydrogenase
MDILRKVSTGLACAAAAWGVYEGVCLLTGDSDLVLQRAPPPPPGWAKDKVVWITGASSGIGEELSRQFAQAGARLILSARRGDELERVRTALALDESRCRIVVLDLSDHVSLPLRAAEAVAAFGGVDILINNGGVSTRSPAHAAAISLDKKVMDVDFFGQIICTKTVLPSMMAAKTGAIVNIVSIAGKMGTPLRTAYCASKFALLGFMDGLRLEMLDHNIAVVNVCPGSVVTNVSANALLANGEKLNITDKGIENGMKVNRCSELILRAIANRLDEVWIASGKELIATYAAQYTPDLHKAYFKKLAHMVVDGMGKDAADRIRAASQQQQQ